MKKIYLILILTAVAITGASKIEASTISLNDDFNGSVVSASTWHIPTWVSSTDGTYIGRTQFRCTQNASLPLTSASFAKIELQTYNPTGFSFYGTDLISNQTFAVGPGTSIIVKAKMNNTNPGIVGGVFLYALKPGSNTLHDEIDFEFLTNSTSGFNTNVYANEPLGTGHPQFTNYTTGSITDLHTYEIRWLPTKVIWLVDGNIVRTNTTNVPTSPMYFHLNMWAPGAEWPEAYNSSLQPVSSSAQNQIFSMSVDSVTIQTIDGSTIGLYNPITSTFYQKNFNSTGNADTSFGFGVAGAGWKPIAGDWNGDGKTTIGLYDPASSVFYLRNSNTSGVADTAFGFGAAGAGWQPIAGDWNADGKTEVGLYDPKTSVFYLRNSATSTTTFGFGVPNSGWQPIAGDWNADGKATIGLYNPNNSYFYLRNSNSAGSADLSFGFGVAGAKWLPVVGDWDKNKTTTIGLYNPLNSTFYLRNSNSSGVAESSFGFGAAGAGWQPIAGNWQGM